MFTSEHRDAVRNQLLGLAEKDPRITGAAVTGSAAGGREDRWSDVDLFFGVADHIAVDAVVADWSGHLYGELGALHHFDLKVPAAVYRAFVLPSCLESTSGSPRPTGSARLARTSARPSARRPRPPRRSSRTQGI